MGAIDERLERGVDLFRRAGDDQALLGAALLAFHGALEQCLDDDLLAQDDLDTGARAQVEQGRLGWPARVDLGARHGLLEPEQARRVVAAARARLAIARGDECLWTAANVQQYGRLVARLCGRMELIARIDQRTERARTTAARAAPPAWSAPRERRRFSPLRFAVGLLLLAALVPLGWVIYNQLDGPRILRALGALPEPTPPPIPTAPPASPTPTARRARLTGLGGGPGWLHLQPTLDSPTRPIRLAEGMEVALREQQQVDSSGTRWQLVEAGGYEGWVPEANLAIEQPAR